MKYVLTVVKRYSTEQPFESLSSDTPFQAFNVGDIIDLAAWGGEKDHILKVKEIRHRIPLLEGAAGIAEHEVILFVDEEVEGDTLIEGMNRLFGQRG